MDELLRLLAWVVISTVAFVIWAVGPYHLLLFACKVLDYYLARLMPNAPFWVTEGYQISSDELEAPLRATEDENAPIGSAGPSLGTRLPCDGCTSQPFYVEQDAASGEDTAPKPQLVAAVDRKERELVELRLRVRDLEGELATVGDIPAGRMVVRGRLVPHQRHFWVIPDGCRPVKLSKVEGWDFPGELGDMVLAEAVVGAHGWAAWRVIVEKVAGELVELDAALVEKLSASKPKREKTFLDLDQDVLEQHVRKASHSAGAVSLHIVCPTHARFGLTEDQANDLKEIVNVLVAELDLGRLEAIEIGHDEKGRQRTHLHLLVSGWNHASSDGIGKMVGRLKALSSGRLRRRYRDLPEKLWSASYWVSSAGGGALDKVKQYIDDNRIKHS